MLSSDPKLPQLSEFEAKDGNVSVGFYRRFQERFYTLWRELARNDEDVRSVVKTGGALSRVVVGDGSASAPAVTKRQDEDTGLYFPAADTVSLATDGTERLRVTSDGRVYGTALHNNAGAVTGATNQYVASGTYAPTITAASNCSVSSPGNAQWMRVGNVVTVSGLCTIDPTSGSGAIAEWYISLPIPSAMTQEYQCAGVISTEPDHGCIKADTANDRAFARAAIYNDTNNRDWLFTFSYVVI